MFTKLCKGNIKWFVVASLRLQLAACVIGYFHPQGFVSIDDLFDADVSIGQGRLVHFLKQLFRPEVQN